MGRQESYHGSRENQGMKKVKRACGGHWKNDQRRRDAKGRKEFKPCGFCPKKPQIGLSFSPSTTAIAILESAQRRHKALLSGKRN